MSLTIVDPTSDRTRVLQLSNLRCPKTTCEDYGKRLFLEVGQDDYGEQGLTVEHSCPACGYVERGPSSPSAARSSSTVRPILERVRDKIRYQDEGVVIPMVTDLPAVEEVEQW